MRFEAWALPANPIALAGSEADAVAQVIALRVKVARGELVDAATDHPHTGGGPVGGVKRTRPLSRLAVLTCRCPPCPAPALACARRCVPRSLCPPGPSSGRSA